MADIDTERAGAARIRALPDFERRMEAARNRAGWELGDRSWAVLIIGAFLDPTADAEALRRDKES